VLIEKLDAETLTELEHQELLHLNEKVEWLNVQRLKAFSQLAEIRQKTIDELMNDLGVKSLSDV
jgi:hypothetical protein